MSCRTESAAIEADDPDSSPRAAANLATRKTYAHPCPVSRDDRHALLGRA